MANLSRKLDKLHFIENSLPLYLFSYSPILFFDYLFKALLAMYSAGTVTTPYAIEDAHTIPSMPKFFAKKNFNTSADNAAAVVNTVSVRIICTLAINAARAAKKGRGG